MGWVNPQNPPRNPKEKGWVGLLVGMVSKNKKLLK